MGSAGVSCMLMWMESELCCGWLQLVDVYSFSRYEYRLMCM